MKILASDAFEGRGATTEGLVRAGDFIADRFRAAGLEPGGDDGTFFQRVDVLVPRSWGRATRLRLGARLLTLGKDYSPNADAAAASGLGPVVFAGYGITTRVGAKTYDDYAGIDARGKVVLLLRYAPGYDAKSQRTADPAFQEGAALRSKGENALRHGALAVILVDPPAQGGGGGIEPLVLGAGSRTTHIASFHVSREAADALLEATGQTVASLQATLDRARRPAPRALPPGAAAEFEVEPNLVRSRNVAAVLEGADPALRDEAVVVGAHYDHLGMGDEGHTLDRKRAIHPGADDNASGTAAVLEIADALAPPAARPRRSIVLVAFTGEERGLVGSTWSAAHPPGKEVVAMINLDMVGRMQGRDLEVGGAPTAAGWHELIEAANEEKLHLTLPSAVLPNSDHAAYLRRNVPSLFFFTGLHGDYHRASDTWDKVNPEGIARSARLALRVASRVANRQEVLAFIPPKWTSMAGAAGGGPRVRLGIVPDHGAAKMHIADVLAGGAAAAVGLKPDDVIRAIDGKPVGNLDDFMRVLGGFKAGDEITVEVERAGVRRSIKVKLDEKGGPARP